MRTIPFIAVMILTLFACKHTKQAASPPKVVEEKVVEEIKTEIPTKSDELSVVSAIFQKNQNVEISRCWKGSKKYFRTQMNVHDGSEKIYDETGKQVASCTPMMRTDVLCTMDKCEVIYTPAKNIWGHKAIDLLGIAN